MNNKISECETDEIIMGLYQIQAYTGNEVHTIDLQKDMKYYGFVKKLTTEFDQIRLTS